MNPEEETLAKEMEETLRTFRNKTRKLFECKPKEKRFSTVPGTILLNQVDQSKMIVKALLGNKPEFVRVMMNNPKYRRELSGWQLLQLAAMTKSGAEIAEILMESLIEKDNFTVGSLDENGWPLISYLYIWDTNRPLKEEEKPFVSFCLDVALFHGNGTTALTLASVGNPSISSVMCAMIGKKPKEMFHVMEPFFNRLAAPLTTPIVSESSLSLNIAHWALALRQPLWFDRLIFMNKELHNCFIPENRMTYLHLACLMGDEKSVDLILSLGKVENPVDKMGFHPLCYNHDYRGSFLKAFLIDRYHEEVIQARFGTNHEFSLLHLAVILGDRQFAYELVFIMKMEIGWKNVNSLSANDLCFILDKVEMFEIINNDKNGWFPRPVEMQPKKLGNLSDFKDLLTPATQ